MKSQIIKPIILVFTIGLIIFVLDLGCPFHNIAGLHCPGCGITRMFISLIQLDIYQAFRYNPLVFIYLMGYIIYLIIKFYNKKFNNKELKIPDKIVYILLVIAVLFGILRNIELFSYLAPTIV